MTGDRLTTRWRFPGTPWVHETTFYGVQTRGRWWTFEYGDTPCGIRISGLMGAFVVAEEPVDCPVCLKNVEPEVIQIAREIVEQAWRAAA